MQTDETGTSFVQSQRGADANGNHEWKVTFVYHLALWYENLLQVLPGSDGFSVVSDIMTVDKLASFGRYPFTYKYTQWEKDSYDLSLNFCFQGRITSTSQQAHQSSPRMLLCRPM